MQTFIPEYPFLSDSDLFRKLEEKKEFNIYKLDRVEVISQDGQKLQHQKLLANIMSSYTLYDSILLYHSMGTGKTIASISIAEQLLSEGFERVLVLVKGKELIEPFREELMKATSRFIGEEEEGPTIRSRNKLMGENYSFSTFTTFRPTNPQNYEKTIIIMDEIHNLIKKGKMFTKTYNRIHRFIHSIRNKKVILMSGTPMNDRPEEIAKVMNLILPNSRQLPTGRAFIQRYIDEDKEGIITYKNEVEFQNKVRGYVSFLKSMKSDVKVEYRGEYMRNYKSFKIFKANMSEFQSKVYASAFSIDCSHVQNFAETDDEVLIQDSFEKDEITSYFSKIERQRQRRNLKVRKIRFVPDLTGHTIQTYIMKSGIYDKSRQASICVFPDGSYGKRGQEKYVKTIAKPSLSDRKKIHETFVLDNFPIKNLEDVKKYSIKFYNTIKMVLDSPGLCFIYCEFLNGSGLYLLSAILKKLGFGESITGSEGDPSLRFTLLSKKTGPQINRIINNFNHSRNRNGQYIKVILGSQAISEGYTFRNVQQVHVLTPHWNFSVIDQAIARALRLFSHEDLTNPTLNIYLHVAMPQNGESVDYLMYSTSEIKDINIKKTERLLKEVSIDCSLMYERNRTIGDDYSRDCEYGLCEYGCHPAAHPNSDSITYNLYFNDFDHIVQGVQSLFQRRFYYRLQEIVHYLSFDKTEVLTGLYRMINLPISIKNKYNHTCYLHEDSDIYFLTPNIFSSSFLESYYDSYIFGVYTPAPAEIVNIKFIRDVIPKIQTIDGYTRLPIELQEGILEEYIRDNQIVPKHLTDKFFDHYVKYLKKRESTIFSFLNPTKYRCLDDNGQWRDCLTDEIRRIKSSEFKDQEDYVTNNPYNFFGILDNNKFKIVNILNRDVVDLKQKPTGKACSSWNKYELVPILLKTDLMSYEKTNKSIDIIDKFLEKSGKINPAEYDEETKYKLFYYLKMLKNQELCEVLKEWFREKEILRILS